MELLPLRRGTGALPRKLIAAFLARDLDLGSISRRAVIQTEKQFLTALYAPGTRFVSFGGEILLDQLLLISL
jgi:hypothetical protein